MPFIPFPFVVVQGGKLQEIYHVGLLHKVMRNKKPINFIFTWQLKLHDFFVPNSIWFVNLLLLKSFYEGLQQNLSTKACALEQLNTFSFLPLAPMTFLFHVSTILSPVLSKFCKT